MPSWIPTGDGIGWTIGIVGIVVAVYIGLRSRKRLELHYQTASVRFFEPLRGVVLPVGARMTFEGATVKRLAKSTVVLWNAGNEVLRGEDIVVCDPIRVRFGDDTRVFSTEVVGTTKTTNGACVQAVANAPHELAVTYDYLDPGDGLVLYALHDGGSGHPRVVGAAKGLSSGARSLGIIEHGEDRRKLGLRWLDWLQSAMYLAILAVFIRTLYRMLLGNLEPSAETTAFPVLAGLFAVATILFAPPMVRLWRTRRRYPRSLAQFVRPSPSVRDE